MAPELMLLHAVTSFGTDFTPDDHLSYSSAIASADSTATFATRHMG
jgi:hypothetical protein